MVRWESARERQREASPPCAGDDDELHAQARLQAATDETAVIGRQEVPSDAPAAIVSEDVSATVPRAGSPSTTVVGAALCCYPFPPRRLTALGVKRPLCASGRVERRGFPRSLAFARIQRSRALVCHGS